LSDEADLPAEVLARATRSGNEFGWPVEDIPQVVEAARVAGLVNIGGQLQFIMPGATCECYCIDVDTSEQAPESLPWSERVQASSAAALAAFQQLREKTDFVAEGRKAFQEHLARYEAAGGKLTDVMRFIWYVEAPLSS
jgi:hypothetical protein